MDYIILNGLKFQGRHGVYPEEKLSPQQFSLDLWIAADLSEAARRDDITATLDYQQLYREVKALVEGESYNLIETLAEKIAALVLKQPLAQSVRVTLEKCRAKSGDDAFTAAVSIDRSRA